MAVLTVVLVDNDGIIMVVNDEQIDVCSFVLLCSGLLVGIKEMSQHPEPQVGGFVIPCNAPLMPCV